MNVDIVIKIDYQVVHTEQTVIRTNAKTEALQEILE